VLILVGWIGPSLAGALEESSSPPDPIADAGILTLGELRSAAVLIAESAPVEMGPAILIVGVSAAATLAWNHVMERRRGRT
jgi:hypothetical protein